MGEVLRLSLVRKLSTTKQLAQGHIGTTGVRTVTGHGHPDFLAKSKNNVLVKFRGLLIHFIRPYAFWL